MRALEFLLELDVINVDAIKQTTEELATNVQNPIAKNWIRKAFGKYFVNEPAHNRRFTETDFEKTDLTKVSDGLKQKIVNYRQNELYVFQPDPTIMQQIENVIHWIQNNEEDERFLRQLVKTTAQVAITKAVKWNVSAAKIEAKIDGVEVVRRYPNGYYWAKFTDKQTMMTDGVELQNCLRHGTYWDMVENERGTIYALRDPQHHPHVGVGVRGDDIIECKGKQNHTIEPIYRRAVIDFFNSVLAGKKPVDPYIEQADIFYNDGKYGDVTSIGEHEKRGDFDFYYLEKRDNTAVYAMLGKSLVFSGTMKEDILGTINLYGVPVDTIISALNAFNMRPSTSAATVLEKIGVVHNNGRYGHLADTAERHDVEDYGYYLKTTNRIFGYDLEGTHKITVTISQDDKLTSFELPEIGDVAIHLLNAIAIPPTENAAEQLRAMNVYSWKGRYGTAVSSVADPVEVDGGYRMYISMTDALLARGSETVALARYTSYPTSDDARTRNAPSHYASIQALTFKGSPPPNGVAELLNTINVRSLRDETFLQLLNEASVVPANDLSKFLPLSEVEAVRKVDDYNVYHLDYKSAIVNYGNHLIFDDGSKRSIVSLANYYFNATDIPEVDDLDGLADVLNRSDAKPKNTETLLEGFFIDYDDDLEEPYHYVKTWASSEDKIDLYTSVYVLPNEKRIAIRGDNIIGHIQVENGIISGVSQSNDAETAEESNAIMLRLFNGAPSKFSDDDEVVFHMLSHGIVPQDGKYVRFADATDLSNDTGVNIYKAAEGIYFIVERYDRYIQYYKLLRDDDGDVLSFNDVDSGNDAEDAVAPIVFNALKIEENDTDGENYGIRYYKGSWYDIKEYGREIVNDIERWDGKDLGELLEKIEKYQDLPDRYQHDLNLDRAESFNNYPDDIEDYAREHNIILMDSHGDAIEGYHIDWDRPATDWDTTNLEFIREQMEEDRKANEDDDEEEDEDQDDDDEDR